MKMPRSGRTLTSLLELVGVAYSVSALGEVTPLTVRNVTVNGVGPRSTRDSYGRLSSAAKPALMRCDPVRYVIEKRCLNGRWPVRNKLGPLPLNGNDSVGSRYRRLDGMPAHGLSYVLAHELYKSIPPSKSSLLLAALFHVPMNSCGWLQYGFPDSIDETPPFRYAKLFGWLFRCHS